MPLSESQLRVNRLNALLAAVVPAPDDWQAASVAEVTGKTIKPLPCSSWGELVGAWKRATHWTKGLQKGLACVLATATSTDLIGGAQLWVRLLGPPSSGKTTLIEAASVSKHFVAKSTLRGLHSGWRDKEEEGGAKKPKKDPSLIAKCRGKTLAIKDADTVRSSEHRGRILAEFRDAYDRVARTDYRNGVANDYLSHDMTVIFCGTASMREMDAAELGVRFIDCVVMDRIDEDTEDAITEMAMLRELKSMSHKTNGKAENNEDTDLMRAKRMTGGYVDYLRENVVRLMRVVQNNCPIETVRRLKRMARFVACMRARPPKGQREVAERELSTRLGIQFIRLATCLAVVLGKESVDGEVVEMVRGVAVDTAKGTVLNLAGRLYGNPVGECGETICGDVFEDDKREAQRFVSFLKKIDVLDRIDGTEVGRGPYSRWLLSESMNDLYAEVLGT